MALSTDEIKERVEWLRSLKPDEWFNKGIQLRVFKLCEDLYQQPTASIDPEEQKLRKAYLNEARQFHKRFGVTTKYCKIQKVQVAKI